MVKILAWPIPRRFKWSYACLTPHLLRKSIQFIHTHQRRGITVYDPRKYSVRNMATTIKMPRDPNTLSNYQNFVTTHTVANFEIDFQNQRLAGNVVLHLKPVLESKSREIFLDTSHLDIKDVKLGHSSPKWSLLPRSEPYGSALKIDLTDDTGDNEVLEVDVSLQETSSLDECC